MTRIVETVAGLRSAPRSGRVAVIMTMGALHDGHAALLRVARKDADFVITTIFVNPLQFGADEDLDRYPRTMEADVAVCEREGTDLIFAPAPREMYPLGEPKVTIDPGPLGGELEGAVRPAHFAGVLTVVLKLLNLTQPAVAFFGEKDYQQLTLIRSMVRDLSPDVEIVGVPTVREPDGLAHSSRNRYLSPSGRQVALSLSKALRAGATRHTADAVLATAWTGLAGLDVDYLELRDPALGPAPVTGPARLLVAARIGAVRLIDNTELELR